MKRVAILGLGLIGGSLGMALRNSGADVFVHGFDKAEAARQLALERGAADICFATAVEAVAQADIVILATPVLQMASLMAEIAEKLPAGCVVSDVGSTKSAVSEALEALLPEHCSYIGGHPMAGGAKKLVSGTVVFAAAWEKSFRGASGNVANPAASLGG